MKSKTLFLLIISFCCVVLIICIITILYQHKAIKRFSDVPQLIEKMRWENTLLKEGFFQTYNYENAVIDYSVDVSDVDGKATRLQNLLYQKNSLVLFMLVGSCRDCIYDNIMFAKNMEKQNVNVIIGIEGLTEYEFKSFVHQYDLKNIAYRLPDNYFKWFDVNPTVYFVVDSNLRSKYFYAPSIVFPDLTQDYFDVVSQYVNLK